MTTKKDTPTLVPPQATPVQPNTAKKAATAKASSAKPVIAKSVAPKPAAAKATAPHKSAKPKVAGSTAAVKASLNTKGIPTEINNASPETPAPSMPMPAKPRQRNPKPRLTQGQWLLKQLPQYLQLMRLDKPIGILLLLWPTLWSLWLAAKGMPRLDLLIIFALGVIVMRSAGCVINDFADRKIDSKVQRTQNRPLARGTVSSREAIILFGLLCLIAFGLVLLTDPLTIKLSVGGLVLAFIYPFMKRHTHLPQVFLGAAFAWSIPMAFAAQAGVLSQKMWLIYLTVVLWTVVYDTFYAMVDRSFDLKIGVKSTAILFGEQDRFITGALQLMTLYSLVLVGQNFELGLYYYLSIAIAAGLFVYQQWLIRFREPQACFNAFLNNQWVGLAIFLGIVVDLAHK